jgi:hypothetical protein
MRNGGTTQKAEIGRRYRKGAWVMKCPLTRKTMKEVGMSDLPADNQAFTNKPQTETLLQPKNETTSDHMRRNIKTQNMTNHSTAKSHFPKQRRSNYQNLTKYILLHLHQQCIACTDQTRFSV